MFFVRRLYPVLVTMTLLLTLTGCVSPRPMPPYLVLLTSITPTTIGQCTGIVVSPREVITPKHCVATVRRVVTVTGQEAWVETWCVLPNHDLVLLITDRVLWVNEFAEFANPELGVQATLYGYSPYTVSHVARYGFYNGLVAFPVEDWPKYDYGMWMMSSGKVYPGDSGSPIIQNGKVVGIVSLASERIFEGRFAYTVPVEYAQELMEIAHATKTDVQATH